MRLLLLLLFCHSLAASEEFFILTLPKSGTHMIYKFLSHLTGKVDGCLPALFPELTTFYFYDDKPPHTISYDALETTCAELKEQNMYPAGHLNFTEPFALFTQKHPEYKKLILIRDLRDVIISQLFWESELIEGEIHSSNLDEKLMFTIRLGERIATLQQFLNISKFVERALWWMKDPDVIVLRYEDFVGSKGGGDPIAQQNAIFAVAQALDIILTDDQLNELCDSIYGPEGAINPYVTYRSGQIGEWKKYFKPVHIQAFKEVYGEQLIALGYEQSLDW